MAGIKSSRATVSHTFYNAFNTSSIFIKTSAYQEAGFSLVERSFKTDKVIFSTLKSIAQFAVALGYIHYNCIYRHGAPLVCFSSGRSTYERMYVCIICMYVRICKAVTMIYTYFILI